MDNIVLLLKTKDNYIYTLICARSARLRNLSGTGGIGSVGSVKMPITKRHRVIDSGMYQSSRP